MKYYIGLLILLISSYVLTDLAIKTRYTRKRLNNYKLKRRNKNALLKK